MNEAVEILITGDFYGGERVEELIQKKQYNHLFNDFLPLIRKADLAITNLESPLVYKGVPIKKTGPAIKAIPETIEALKYAGFNLLTLANNHIMDYGPKGLHNTIDLCKENEIDTVGAGENFIMASKTYFKELKGLKIGIINIAENEWSTTNDTKPGAHPLNPVANFYKIKEAKEYSDFVIVVVHGGIEMYNLPSLRMKESYRFFVDVGADIVIGHHTHCFSGYEVYNESPIFYSLGNFLFDTKLPKSNSWSLGYAIRMKISQKSKMSFEIIPYEQYFHQDGIKLLNGQQKDSFIDELEKLNIIIQDDVLLDKNFNDFFHTDLKHTYRSLIEPLSFKPLRILQKLGVLPSILNERKKRLYLNLIRCEAHRDIVIKLLNDDSNS